MGICGNRERRNFKNEGNAPYVEGKNIGTTMKSFNVNSKIAGQSLTDNPSTRVRGVALSKLPNDNSCAIDDSELSLDETVLLKHFSFSESNSIGGDLTSPTESELDMLVLSCDQSLHPPHLRSPPLVNLKLRSSNCSSFKKSRSRPYSTVRGPEFSTSALSPEMPDSRFRGHSMDELDPYFLALYSNTPSHQTYNLGLDDLYFCQGRSTDALLSPSSMEMAISPADSPSTFRRKMQKFKHVEEKNIRRMVNQLEDVIENSASPVSPV